jgi:hypothetical protein
VRTRGRRTAARISCSKRRNRLECRAGLGAAYNFGIKNSRSSWKLLAVSVVPSVILAFVLWGVLQNLRSLVALPQSILTLSVLVPVAIYAVLERVWVKRRGIGTIARSLILLIFIFIPVGIVTPGLEGVFVRQRQKDTMIAMRTVGVALEVYAVNHGHYPVSEDEIGRFANAVPRKDAWGHPFILSLSATSYTILSQGFDVKRLDDDIVYRDGQFTRAPDGIVLPPR